ncbi:MAG: CBS domain-containing protein, partial [Thermodesulfobacteriota bacterium]|nr:CBS domain-containing protein [Thermodesulfobacteriota bacterium]
MEVITTHLNADFDSLSSMLAAKKLYPEAVPVFPGSKEKGLREFFLHSATYIFNVEQIKHIDIEKITRLILVDTRQSSRIGVFKEIIGKKGLDIHIYDHHLQNSDDIRGSFNLIEKVGATTTIFCELLKEKGFDITPDEATIMMVGIYEDTGNFTYISTTTRDFLAAAYLREKGANLNIVSDLITKELTSEQVYLLNELKNSATKYNIKGVEVLIATAKSEKYIGYFAVLVHKLMDMKNLNVIFALCEMEDKVYLVVRSRQGEVNAGEIALEFGGGGHPSAASATIKDLTIIQVKEKLLEILNAKILATIKAKDIISTPVISVSRNKPICTAGDILTRYNINVLPVIDKDKPIGLISRQVVEKAIFHGFKNMPVSQFMTTEFSVVDTNAGWNEITNIVIEDNQRLLPVMENEKLKGVLTRTDVMKTVHSYLTKEPRYLSDAEYEYPHRKRKIIKSLIKEMLPKDTLEILMGMGELAREMDMGCHAVGGFVRDLLLRIKNLDVDVVIEGDGILFARTMAKKLNLSIKVHKNFGTSRVYTSSKNYIDIASARLEYYKHPGALPTVESSSLKLDLYRRDFTINTLAINLSPEHFGELLDYFGGRQDLKEKSIRVIHNLSFIEDPTRIFRAIRFSHRFSFSLSKQTSNMIKNAVKLNILEKVSGQRLFYELKQILDEKEPVAIIETLDQYDLLKYFHPGIKFNKETENILKKLMEVYNWFQLSYFEENVEKWMILLLGLTDLLDKFNKLKFLAKLGITKKAITKKFEEGFQIADIQRNIFLQKDLQPGDIYRFLYPYSNETLLYLMAKSENESIRKAVSLYLTKLQYIKPQIGGNELVKMGIAPGKIFKEINERLRDEMLNGR